MRLLLPLSLVLTLQLADAGGAFAQRTRQKAPAQRADTPSVVLVPKSQQQVVDTTLLLPEEERPRRSRRKFRVMVVPAAPPGQSRQQILYSDSLAHMAP